ncbi:MAG TPA: hypothetical protein DEQ30_03575 [Porphyromonadaceae bacterium]|nr:hypothetical protein [Porphyromonadaceae bacterium]
MFIKIGTKILKKNRKKRKRNHNDYSKRLKLAYFLRQKLFYFLFILLLCSLISGFFFGLIKQLLE